MQNQKTAADKKEAGRWSKQEHERFMLGLMQHGKNWKKVEDVVGTRSGSQVRSHAQKFFTKIQKCSQDTKNKKSKKLEQNADQNNDQQVSFTENNDILKSLQEDNSLATPIQIISLIKKQSIDNRKVHLSSFKKSLQQNQLKQLNQIPRESTKIQQNKSGQENPQNQFMVQLNSFKSMNNILSAYQALNQTDPQNRFQDQSFLIGLTKKYKKYFTKGGHFQNLIDFGNPHEIAKVAQQIERPYRKKSWTLAQGIQGNENDLQDIKKKLKDQIQQKKEGNTRVIQTKTNGNQYQNQHQFKREKCKQEQESEKQQVSQKLKQNNLSNEQKN